VVVRVEAVSVGDLATEAASKVAIVVLVAQVAVVKAVEVRVRGTRVARVVVESTEA
jgi:hypothetical protein